MRAARHDCSSVEAHYAGDGCVDDADARRAGQVRKPGAADECLHDRTHSFTETASDVVV